MENAQDYSDLDGAHEPSAAELKASSSSSKWRRRIGLLLLALIIFLWTATNFLTSAMMADHSFSKPYFVTYFDTAFFTLPMIPVLILKAYRNPSELRDFRRDLLAWLWQGTASSRRPFGRDDRQMSRSTSSELLLGGRRRSSHDSNADHYDTKLKAASQLSLFETAKLTFEFCILWFLANYFVISCLEHTTVASATILTSLSGVFTLIFGSYFGVERFTIRKLLGVVASLVGIVLISSVDISGKSSDDAHRGDFPQKTLREVALGNVLAFLSAVVYGLYSVFMKKRIADESKVNMPIFFGFVGLINILMLWPGFLILHFAGVETFELPSDSRTAAILISNAVGSTVSDLSWAYAVILTSPIVVTVGLSMTIPLSLIGQMILNSQTSSLMYWVGAIVVVLSFVIVNQEEKHDESLSAE